MPLYESIEACSSQTYQRMRLILGDQLNAKHSWYRDKDPTTLYVCAELIQEAQYCTHHIQKIAGFFAAMHNFCSALGRANHRCLHLNLDHTADFDNLNDLLAHLAATLNIQQFEYQQPDEIRLSEQLAQYSKAAKHDSALVDSEHFFIQHRELADHADYVSKPMEGFYRQLRKKTGYLMDEFGQPEGGQWNLDKENRQSLSSSDLDQIPEPKLFNNPIAEVVKRIQRHNIKTIGSIGKTLSWPTTRRQALALLQYFLDHQLANFGRFQDAMTANSEHAWSLYHSRLAFALNTKMLDPKEVIGRAIEHYRRHTNDINLAQIEGFVRQILGWREFIRVVYWADNSSYRKQNFLSANKPLPDFFWTGQTRMRCLSEAINQSLDYGYAHHIQRLMVTGNFALLAGIDPDAVEAWYLGIYVDAIEWVEQPNTRGMALFADGGLLATKPYAASGNYINKMSDYCKSCQYRVKERDSENACPLNSLYWAFLEEHRAKLGDNHRLAMVYRQWDKKPEQDKKRLLIKAKHYLDHIDTI